MIFSLPKISSKTASGVSGRKPVQKILGSLVVAAGVTGAVATADADSAEDSVSDNARLEDFRHVDGDGTVTIDVDDAVFQVAILSTKEQAESLTAILNQMDGDRAVVVGSTDGLGRITVKLDQIVYNQPSVVTFSTCQQNICERKGYIELLRQSPRSLVELFGITKEYGYTVLGRTDMTLVPTGKRPEKFRDYIFVDTAPIEIRRAATEGLDREMPKAIFNAVAITRELWSEPVPTGPSDKRVYNPYVITAAQYIDMLRAGEGSVQCTKFRNLFLSFAEKSLEIPEVRGVEMLQFFHPVGDLSLNGHSAAEIYSAKLDKWIFIDPWMGLMIKLNGEFVAAEELSRMTPEDRNNAEIISVSERRRYLQTGHAKSEDEFSDQFSDVLMNNGYFEYFNFIRYRGISLKQSK